MPIRNKAIKAIKDLIVDLKKTTNKEKPEKRSLLRAHDDEENLLLYQSRKYNEKQIYQQKYIPSLPKIELF